MALDYYYDINLIFFLIFMNRSGFFCSIENELIGHDILDEKSTTLNFQLCCINLLWFV